MSWAGFRNRVCKGIERRLNYFDFFFSSEAVSSRSALSSLKATITYPMSTTFATRAARPPAYVVLPVFMVSVLTIDSIWVHEFGVGRTSE